MERRQVVWLDGTSSRRRGWVRWARWRPAAWWVRWSRGLILPAAAATTALCAGRHGRVHHRARPGGRPRLHLRLRPGRREPSPSTSSSATYKGHAQHTAPHLDFRQNDDIRITLTNLGLVQRPDLTDSHTIHWHGFDVPSPLNDGVPEVSVAVPIGKQVTYFYRPHREGTYMYHCHFEDVEHVQMGMTGIVFVRPLQDGAWPSAASPSSPTTTATASTGYDRHFAILLNEIWTTSTTATATSRSPSPTDYDPQWFTLNGRCYPQTVLPNDERHAAREPADRRPTTPTTARRTTASRTPRSSRSTRGPGPAPAGQPRLQQHAMQLPGIPMHVVGQDASCCCGTGRRRHVVLDEHALHRPRRGARRAVHAPAYNASRPSGSDGRGATTSTASRTGTGEALEPRAPPGPAE